MYFKYHFSSYIQNIYNIFWQKRFKLKINFIVFEYVSIHKILIYFMILSVFFFFSRLMQFIPILHRYLNNIKYMFLII